jgi:hypothetical protein
VPPEPTDESLARMGHNFDAEYDEDEYVPPYDYINDPLGMLHD